MNTVCQAFFIFHYNSYQTCKASWKTSSPEQSNMKNQLGSLMMISNSNSKKHDVRSEQLTRGKQKRRPNKNVLNMFSRSAEMTEFLGGWIRKSH